ncbi:hypothetical protein [Archangium sp.]|uniref:hypothetical protein n=1 Tax=Archangium sp. TaxID=1872627 RepID=UPI00286D545A|nr:hypothetical protein [Archangium sp.]
MRKTRKAPKGEAPKLDFTPAVPVYTLEDFPLWVPTLDEVVAGVAMKRMGKGALKKRWMSFLLKAIAECSYGLDERWGLVSIDIHDEDSQLGREREDCWLGPLTQRLTVAEFLERVDSDDLVLNREGLALSIVTEEPEIDPAGVADQVRQVLRYLRDRGFLFLFFDELGYWARFAETELHAVAAVWAKEGIVPFFWSQVIDDIPVQARKQLTHVVSGRQVKRSDLLFLRDQAGRPVAGTVYRLPKLHYVRADLTQPTPELLHLLTQ